MKRRMMGFIASSCIVSAMAIADDSAINQLLNDAQPKVKSAEVVKSSSTLGMADMMYAQTLNGHIPLTPEQIRALHYVFDQSQKAVADYPGVSPTPTSSAVSVSLSPGATPPLVRLRQGYVTSLVFVDATGQPWPIAAYDLGDPKAFNVQWDRKSNTLLVQASTVYHSGNLAVILKGAQAPVMLTLMPGQQAVDYRVDLHVPGLGPNAQADMGGLPSTVDPQLIHFLNGVPASGAQPVVIEGDHNQSQAWVMGKQLFLRTQATLLSPGWVSTMSSPDGTHVYQLTLTPSLLVSRHGASQRLTIKGL